MNDVMELLRQTVHFAGRYGMPVKVGEDEVLQLALNTFNYLKMKETGKEFNGNFNQAETYLKELESILSESTEDADSAEVSEPLYFKAYQAAEKMIVGGRNKSDLESYGYDMVYAFTFGAINSVMKQYVMKMGEVMQPEARFYVYRQNPNTKSYIIEEATSEETAALKEKDLFSIPNEPNQRTSQQKKDIDEAWTKYKVAYAFQASFGIPEGFEPSQIDNILDFNLGETGNHTKVKYLMYFKDFSIIQWSYNPFNTSMDFSNLKQGKELWAFSFDVDLGLVNTDESTLSDEIRRKINNIDQGNMFSIQQLFLDLNTTALQNFPTIKGVSNEAMETLNSKFVNVYFQKLRELGDVVFAYSIQPGKKQSKPYFLTPKDFKFYVSPYYENGKASGKKELYTLNYIVSCGNAISVIKPFTWNWVDEAQYKTVNGAMAINKNKIYSFAADEYKLLVGRLLFIPYANMNIPNPIEMYVQFGIGKDSSTQVSFKNNKFHYEKNAESSDTFVPLWGNIEIKYTLDALIRSYQSEDDKAVLECRVDTEVYLHVNVEGGVSEGTILNKSTWYTLEHSVDAYACLKFEPKIKEVDNGTTFDVSEWSKLIASDFSGMINDITNLINRFINENTEFAQGAFCNRYNNNVMWLLPGDQSLIFKDPRFSEGMDLTFDANYAKP